MSEEERYIPLKTAFLSGLDGKFKVMQLVVDGVFEDFRIRMWTETGEVENFRDGEFYTWIKPALRYWRNAVADELGDGFQLYSEC